MKNIAEALAQKGLSAAPTSFVFSAVTYTPEAAERWVRANGFSVRKTDTSRGAITVEVASAASGVEYGSAKVAPGVVALAPLARKSEPPTKSPAETARKQPMNEPPPEGPPATENAQASDVSTRLADLETRISKLESDVQSLLSAVFVDAGPVGQAPPAEAAKAAQTRKSGLAELSTKMDSLAKKTIEALSLVGDLRDRLTRFEEALVLPRRGTGVLEQGLVAKNDGGTNGAALFDSAFPWRRRAVKQ